MTIERGTHTAKGKDGNTSCHLALNVHRHFQNQLLNGLNGAGLDDCPFILLRTCGEVPQSRNGMTLDLLVILERQEVDQWLQKACFNDRGLVHGVNGHVTGTRSRGED